MHNNNKHIEKKNHIPFIFVYLLGYYVAICVYILAGLIAVKVQCMSHINAVSLLMIPEQ